MSLDLASAELGDAEVAEMLETLLGGHELVGVGEREDEVVMGGLAKVDLTSPFVRADHFDFDGTGGGEEDEDEDGRPLMRASEAQRLLRQVLQSSGSPLPSPLKSPVKRRTRRRAVEEEVQEVQEVEALGVPPTDSTAVEVLMLCDNHVSYTGMILLSACLHQFSALRELYLDGNPLHDEGCQALFAALSGEEEAGKVPPIRVLDVSNVGMTDLSVDALVAMLTAPLGVARSLRVLSVRSRLKQNSSGSLKRGFRSAPVSLHATPRADTPRTAQAKTQLHLLKQELGRCRHVAWRPLPPPLSQQEREDDVFRLEHSSSTTRSFTAPDGSVLVAPALPDVHAHQTGKSGLFNQLTSRGAKSIATALESPFCHVEELQLDGNPVGGFGIRSLITNGCSATTRLRRLTLSWVSSSPLSDSPSVSDGESFLKDAIAKSPSLSSIAKAPRSGMMRSVSGAFDRLQQTRDLHDFVVEELGRPDCKLEYVRIDTLVIGQPVEHTEEAELLMRTPEPSRMSRAQTMPLVHERHRSRPVREKRKPPVPKFPRRKKASVKPKEEVEEAVSPVRTKRKPPVPKFPRRKKSKEKEVEEESPESQRKPPVPRLSRRVPTPPLSERPTRRRPRPRHSASTLAGMSEGDLLLPFSMTLAKYDNRRPLWALSNNASRSRPAPSPTKTPGGARAKQQLFDDLDGLDKAIEENQEKLDKLQHHKSPPRGQENERERLRQRRAARRRALLSPPALVEAVTTSRHFA